MSLDMEEAIIAAVERLTPSVVRVHGRRNGAPKGTDPIPVEGAGSGFVWDERGHIVTNDHVVRGSRNLSVVTPDLKIHVAEVVGEDPATDVALLQIGSSDLIPAPLGDSEKLRVGQFALAVGNSLGLPGGPTVSSGLVSALNRPLPGADYVLEGLIQTDAAINPGNSGGPLADLPGRVIGVNTAVVPYAQGVGFAVPINTVRTVVDQLVTQGRVVRPWLGVSAVGLSPTNARRYRIRRDEGILLAEIIRGGPAEAAGLSAGDVLLRMGDRPIRTLHDLLTEISKLPIGGAVDVTFERANALRKSVLRVAESPALPPRT